MMGSGPSTLARSNQEIGPRTGIVLCHGGVCSQVSPTRQSSPCRLRSRGFLENRFNGPQGNLRLHHEWCMIVIIRQPQENVPFV